MLPRKVWAKNVPEVTTKKPECSLYDTVPYVPTVKNFKNVPYVKNTSKNAKQKRALWARGFLFNVPHVTIGKKF